MSRRRVRLSGGIRFLTEHRDGDGRWRRFPFYYTLLALTEIGGREATAEMRYAGRGLERITRRGVRGGGYEKRRRALAERALGMI